MAAFDELIEAAHMLKEAGISTEPRYAVVSAYLAEQAAARGLTPQQFFDQLMAVTDVHTDDSNKEATQA